MSSASTAALAASARTIPLGRARRHARSSRALSVVRAKGTSPPDASSSSSSSSSSSAAWAPVVTPVDLTSSGTNNAVPALRSALVRFGFPKGSLQKSTEELFARAGMPVKVKDRNYFPTCSDEDLAMVLFRSQEIPRYVEDGVIDVGVCGHDWVVENDSDVVEVAELRYSKATSNPASWVVAVPEDSPVRELRDLEGTIVASELVRTTRAFFEAAGVDVKVEYSWGATEVKASLPGVGAIVDITETGSSLRANKLRIVDTILASTTRLIANRDAWADPRKRAKIEDLALLLNGAIDGRRKMGLKMNLRADLVEELSAVLPSEKSPTVSPLMDAKFCAVEVIVDEREAVDLVPVVRRLGATGIVTYPVNIAIR